MAAWGLATGVLWCLSLHPQAYAFGDGNGGLGLAMGGALLLLLSTLGVLYDPVPYACPVCDSPVSGWVFSGAYLRPLHGPQPGAACKVHRHHLRCLYCTRPFSCALRWWDDAGHRVVQDLWGASPVARPYHVVCWNEHCLQFITDAQYQAHWAAQQSPPASDAELVHMLATAIQEWDLPSIECLLRLRPGLHTLPISDQGGLTAVRLATRLGGHHVVDQLREFEPLVLPQHCVMDEGAGHSLAVQGLDAESDDLYVYEPVVRYNGQRVYVGHTHGKYIYYYKPQPEDKRQYEPGWCLSPHLGTGKPSFRLVLPGRPKATAPKPKAGRCFWWGAMMRCFACGPVARDSQAVDVSAPRVRHVSADHIHLLWVPHSTGLLHDAVASGSEATLQYVLQLYQQSHPHALVRRRYTDQGLWEQHQDPRHVQCWSKVRAPGQEVRPLGTDDTGAYERCCLRTLFQHLDPQGRLIIGSEVRLVDSWDGASVVVSSGHIAAVAPSSHILDLLIKEGVVDHTLWDIPCNGQVVPVKCNGSSLSHSPIPSPELEFRKRQWWSSPPHPLPLCPPPPPPHPCHFLPFPFLPLCFSHTPISPHFSFYRPFFLPRFSFPIFPAPFPPPIFPNNSSHFGPLFLSLPISTSPFFLCLPHFPHFPSFPPISPRVSYPGPFFLPNFPPFPLIFPYFPPCFLSCPIVPSPFPPIPPHFPPFPPISPHFSHFSGPGNTRSLQW